MGSQSSLKPREARFVREYVTAGDGNVYAAAIRAGYPESSARMTRRITDRPAIKAAIDRYVREILADLEIDAKRVLCEVAGIAFGNMADFITVDDDGQPGLDLRDVSRDKLAAVASVSAHGRGLPGEKSGGASSTSTFRLTLYDKIKALALLAKHLGLDEGAHADVQPVAQVVIIGAPEAVQRSPGA